MKVPSYKDQFDRLTTAYINDEIQPFDCKACFVGNLLYGSSSWVTADILECRRFEEDSHGLYTPKEIKQLERVFMNQIHDLNPGIKYRLYSLNSHCLSPQLQQEYEEVLFQSFERALEALKQLHLNRGEVIDEVPVFTKRKLQYATANI